MTILTFIGALISKLLYNKNSFITAILVSIGVLIAVFCRIVFDVIHDSTTHNMLPFEIIFDSFMIGSSAFGGSYLGQLINYIKTK